MESIKWEQPEAIRFPDQSIHVWLGDLRKMNRYLELFKRNLSPAEVAKSLRSPIEKVRHHQIVSRGILRSLLGFYLKKPPDTLEFMLNEHGKPSLVGGSGAKPLHFNLTHSQNLMLLAFSDCPDIGIDCECFEGHRVRNWSALSKSVFTGMEQRKLVGLQEHQKEQAFYRVWTRKEAYTKAIGDGFQYGFQNFSVSMDTDQTPQIIEDKNNPKASEQWQLFDLMISESSMASLCIRKPRQTPKFAFYHLPTGSWFK